MSPESQVSPLVSRLWGRLIGVQGRLAQVGPEQAERIYGVEFKALRTKLGLSVRWLADQYKLTAEEIAGWERDNALAPSSIGAELVKLALTTGALVENETDRLQRSPMSSRTVTVYATEAAYHRAHPEAAPLPTSWHQAVYARVAANVGGVRLLQEN